MRLAIGHSIDPLESEALREVVRQVHEQLGPEPARGGMVLCCLEADHQQILDGLAEAFPGMPLIGCTTDGELSSRQGFQEDSLLLIVFGGEEVAVRVGLGSRLSGDVDAAACEALADARADAEPRAKLCIAIPESLTASAVSVVSCLARRLGPDVPLVGGTAGDQWRFEQTYQFKGRDIVSDALPILLLCGPIDVGVGVSSGWEPLGKRGIVTSVEGHVVREIDCEPAIEFFEHAHGTHVQPNPEHPIGVFDDAKGEHYLRAPLAYDRETGTVSFAGDVPAGSEVQVTSASREGILEACSRSIEAARRNLRSGCPTGALVFSCAARKQLLGTRTPEEVKILRDVLQKDLPFGGFYTYGEIAPMKGRPFADFHNETFVTVLLGLTHDHD